MSDWSEHREALDYFVRNETSLGCYGSGDVLHKARKAMVFFAQDDGLRMLLTELERVEQQRSELRTAIEHRIVNCCDTYKVRNLEITPCSYCKINVALLDHLFPEDKKP